jgi:hypothetical protein
MAATSTKSASKGNKGSQKASGKSTKVTQSTKQTASEPKVKGLGKPAIRVLQCLAKSKSPLTRAEIAEKAPVDIAWVSLFVGFKDGREGGKDDLVAMGAAKVTQQDVNGRDVLHYSITAKGRQVLEKALKAAK